MTGNLLTRSDIETTIFTQYEKLNRGDLDGFLELWDQDAVFTFPGTNILGGVYRGKAEIQRFFWLLRQVIVGLRFDINQVLVNGEYIAMEWEDSGRTIQGEPFNNQGVTIMRLRDGRLVEARDYLDTEKLKAFSMGRKNRSGR